MSKRTTTTRARLLRCPAASFWIKRALEDSARRDLLDAARDAQLLADVLADELDALQAHAGADIAQGERNYRRAVLAGDFDPTPSPCPKCGSASTDCGC